MQKNLIAVVISVLALVIVFALYTSLRRPKNNDTVTPLPTITDQPSGKMVTGTDLETFSGNIESVDTGCFADATCSVTVDGKKIILVTGGRGMNPNAPVGKLIGVESIGDLESKIGSHANVYAGVTDSGDHTLYGNNSYYVEVTGETIKR